MHNEVLRDDDAWEDLAFVSFVIVHLKFKGHLIHCQKLEQLCWERLFLPEQIKNAIKKLFIKRFRLQVIGLWTYMFETVTTRKKPNYGYCHFRGTLAECPAFPLFNQGS